MSPLPAKQRRTDIRIGGIVAALVLVVWCAEMLGLFRPLDQLAYDVGLRVKSRLNPIAARVLMIRAGRDLAASTGQIERVVQRLQALNAGPIAFAFPPPHAHCFAADSRFATVRFGQPVTPTARDPRVLQSHASAASFQPGLQGALFIPPSTDGVHRLQALAVSLEGTLRPTLEAAVAALAVDRKSDEAGTFRIDFRGGAGSLPHTTMDDVTSGRLIPEMVAGMTVVIGVEADPADHGVTTPVTKGIVQMSTTEYHAHAMNTLLARGEIRDVPPAAKLVMLIGIACCAACVFQRGNVRAFAWLIAATVLAICGLSIACLTWCQLWIPWCPAIVALGAVFSTQCARRMRYLRMLVQRLSVEQAVRVRRRRWPTDPVTAQDPWPQLLDFVAQLIPFHRIAVLEVHPGKQHMLEAGFRGCGRADIVERRRDFSRMPYRETAKSRTASELTADHPFFRSIDAHQQFLLPFCFAGETFGFMALDVPAVQIESRERFLESLQTISKAVSEILYQRSCHLLESAADPILHDRERLDAQQLVVDTRNLDSRLSRLEHMFQSSDVATIVYDLYGHVLMINDKMSKMLTRERVAAAKCNATELIQELAGCDELTAKSLFSDIALRCQVRTIAGGQESRPITLVGKPLNSDTTGDLGGRTRLTRSPDIWGIEFVVIDPDQFKAFDWLEAELSASLDR